MLEHFIITWGTEVSFIIRLVAAIIILFFFLPLQVKEAGVKNGLKRLRYQLLAEGVIVFMVNLTSMFFLWDLYVRDVPQKFINSSLQVINALAFFFIAAIALMIYRQSYTEDQKELHEKIGKLEEKRAQEKK